MALRAASPADNPVRSAMRVHDRVVPYLRHPRTDGRSLWCMVVAYGAVTGGASGRSVLQGAFVLLENLSCAEDGLCLTELVHKSGLAKTTVHRLVEQLVDVGAAQCIEHRYFIGPAIARFGRRWQPDPRLRQAACEPIRTLAGRAHTAAAVYVMCDGQAHLVTAAVYRGLSWLPPRDVDSEFISRTAIGRVLLAVQDEPGCGGAAPAPQWRRLSASPRRWRTVCIDDPDTILGLCWVAAPLRDPGSRRIAAVAALVRTPALPAGLPDLVTCAAQQISQHLR